VSASTSAGWVGRSIPRKEENRLLRGRGKFIDDIKMRDMGYLRFVRSPYAHARINGVDVAAAEALPGVFCVVTGQEVLAQTQPFIEIGPEPAAQIRDFPLASDKVRYQGEPVVAIVAESARVADDAAELVNIDYEPLDPVVTVDQALADTSLLHSKVGTNRTWAGVYEYGYVAKAF